MINWIIENKISIIFWSYLICGWFIVDLTFRTLEMRYRATKLSYRAEYRHGKIEQVENFLVQLVEVAVGFKNLKQAAVPV